MTDFAGTPAPLARALALKGYEAATPVQEAVLDPALAGADLLVSAQTGSGKTVAFGIAIAPTLLDDAEQFGEPGAPLALAIAPTRELAMQVRRELEWLYADTGAAIASCVGGMDPRAERRALERGAHIVVGTPGRLRDHIDRRALDLGSLRAVVLDEADEMLDLGFREDLEFILERTPAERRTLMFSATVPRGIEGLARSYQRDAVRVSTTSERSQHADIAYQVLLAAPRERDAAIVNALRYHEAANALVFCNTRAAVAHLVARLSNRGFRAVALSGELSQAERTHALQALRDGRARVCVATDVAARGIDLPRLELVVHADLPSNPETLLHRSGRTGRAGRKGVSALIVEPRARARAERLLRAAKLNAEWTTPPSAEAVSARDEERLLTDAAFTEPPQPDEAAFAARVLAEHGPEAVAVAALRMARKDRSAPEEVTIIDVNAPRLRREADAPVRRSFDASAWFSLSVGRRQNAEPRWLIPMLMNNARIDKRDIGAIRMQPEETFLEVDAAKAERFFASLGRDRMLEGKVRVNALDGPPEPGPRPAPRRDGPRPAHAKGGAGDDDAGERRDERPARRKPRHAEEAPREVPPPRAKRRSDEKRSQDDAPKHDASKHEAPAHAGPPTETGPADAVAPAGDRPLKVKQRWSKEKKAEAKKRREARATR